jgi:hypothetical protein
MSTTKKLLLVAGLGGVGFFIYKRSHKGGKPKPKAKAKK